MKEYKNIFSKVVINFGIGGDETKRTHSINFINSFIPERTPLESRAKKTSKDLGYKKNSIMGISLTIRKGRGLAVLKKLIKSRTKIPSYSINSTGSFSFGISDLNHIPDINTYIPIKIGMDVSIALQNKGHRVALRKRRKGKLPARHYVAKKQIMEFINNELGVSCQDE